MSALLLLSLLFGMPFVMAGMDTSTGSDDTETEPEPQDSLIGTDGDDTIDGTEGDDLIQALGGFDMAFGNGGNDTVLGGADDDLLGGGEGDDQVDGEDGWDTVYGWTGDDTLDGGADQDLLYGDDGDDLLSGGTGNDTLYGDDGIDTLLGGDGDDLMYDASTAFDDGPYHSVMDGGAGDDTLSALGASTLTGGTGADVLRWESVPGAGPLVITDFDPAEDRLDLAITVEPGETGTLSLTDWDNGLGADLYLGDTLMAQITGAQGLSIDDLGVTLLLQEDGGDMSYTDGDSGVTILGNYDDNTINGGGGDDRITVGESLFYTATYQDGENLAQGGDGNDTLIGTGGTEYNYTLGDEDFYEMDIHIDTLEGGAGDDVLLSVNRNVMTGGTGADTFGLIHEEADGELGFEAAVITDFDPTEDQIAVQVGPVGNYAEVTSITIEVWEDGLGANVLVDGMVAAEVAGGQDLQVSDIVQVQWLGDLLAA
ncbi:calcium-binding protein [Tropicibacter naphthalenivorans]|uniref:Hemolysin, plasmid n=1 Tax=Tropicibacter naphthalenivorans TaxID=441103 RepID=A0A0P1GKC2_9RHOB|nr:calcium-binding protein [Tropicibacter naphthalenivorans]CUH82636.1 Hemolysin, plasmid [Tropicibacter naphthalenivorans]SMD09037.1 Hemolysin-type calcium-binding repeat-containing protein [Tropicibacter naphthalenivorans]